jgi:nucleoside-diphosphate-sugar epimerase
LKPLPADDPRQRKPDIKLAKKLFSWKPKISLEEGLFLTINWFKQNPGH